MCLSLTQLFIFFVVVPLVFLGLFMSAAYLWASKRLAPQQPFDHEDMHKPSQ